MQDTTNYAFDSYQPDLYITNIPKSTHVDTIYRVMNKYNYGYIGTIEIIPKQYWNEAVIVYRYWKTNLTESTRLLLHRGKYLTIGCDESQYRYWKVYSYDAYHRQLENRRKIEWEKYGVRATNEWNRIAKEHIKNNTPTGSNSSNSTNGPDTELRTIKTNHRTHKKLYEQFSLVDEPIEMH